MSPPVDRRRLVVPVSAPVFGLTEPLEAPFPGLPFAPTGSSGLLETSASLCVDFREPARSVFAVSPGRFEPALELDPEAPWTDPTAGSAVPTFAAAREQRGRPPAAAVDLEVAAADLGVSTGAATALVFSPRCRLPPPDTDPGVCSPSAARFRVRIRSVGKYVLHSFGLSRLCWGYTGGWVRNRTQGQNMTSSQRVTMRWQRW